jgi:hypothetical protein
MLTRSSETIVMCLEILTCGRLLPAGGLSGKFGGFHVSLRPGDQFAPTLDPCS